MDRLQRALVFIEEHLTEPLDLERVAGAAALSPYHFSRLFRRVVGDSVMGHVRRRRLSYAARRMRESQDRLLDIAFDVGFESQEAFHRAFKRQCGVTPGAYRRLPGDLRAAIDLLLLTPLPKESAQMSDMTPRFVDKEAFTLIGLSQRIAQGKTQEIPAIWERLMARYDEVPVSRPEEAYGLCTMIEDEEGAFDYLAGLPVAPGNEPPADMVRRAVPALHYAVFTHKAEDPDLSTHLPKTMNHIFGVWLPASDYELSAAIDFELYDARFDPDSKTGEIDIYLPVKRRG